MDKVENGCACSFLTGRCWRKDTGQHGRHTDAIRVASCHFDGRGSTFWYACIYLVHFEIDGLKGMMMDNLCEFSQ